MRITLGMLTDSVRNNLFASTEGLMKSQEIAATGKRISRPSDDVVGTGRALSMRSALASIDQFGRNTDIANSELGVASSALDSLVSAVQEIRSVALTAANSSLNDEARGALATKLDGLMNRIEEIANTQNAGRYIFAGSKSDAAPITWNADHSVHTYNGDQSPLAIRVGPQTSISVSVAGDSLLNIGGVSVPGVPDLFETINNLKQDVLAGDVQGISDQIADIDASLNNVSSWRSQVGARLDQLESNTSALLDSKTNLSELLSQIEDADLADSVIQLQIRQNVYQAAIATANQILNVSLANMLNQG